MSLATRNVNKNKIKKKDNKIIVNNNNADKVITNEIIILFLQNYNIGDRIKVNLKKFFEIIISKEDDFPLGILIDKYIEYLIFKKKSIGYIFYCLGLNNLKNDDFINESSKEVNYYEDI